MAIVFDIGGTRMRVAYTTDGSSFEKPLITPTPPNFEEALKTFFELVRAASLGREVGKMAGGLPGTLAPDRSGLLLAPNLKDWARKPFVERIKQEFGSRVVLSNDAALVALGEALHGAGKGYDIVGYLTFSTGIGGARITHGVPDQTAFSFEPGKLEYSVSDELRTVESIASGGGMWARYGKAPYDIHDAAIWSEAAKAAAYEAHAAMLFWSPSVLVLGGPMIVGEPAIPFFEIETEARRLLGERGDELTLKKATLESLGGLWGGLSLLTQENL